MSQGTGNEWHFIVSYWVHHLSLFPVIFETVTVPVPVDTYGRLAQTTALP
jgi:hypothetical protein